MNILPKKKWHVRTKENVARVRRDQKQAAEEAKRISERFKLAEQEFKVNLLRKNAGERFSNCYGIRRTEDNAALPIVTSSGHVNFFADLEEETRKNYGTGNKEYEEEKKKEREEYESKVGILKYLGEGSNELTKQKSWYEKVPEQRSRKFEEVLDKSKFQLCGIQSLEQSRMSPPRKKRRKEKEKKHDYKKEQHFRKKVHSRKSSGHSCFEEETKRRPNSDIEKLRLERLNREKTERQKVAMLFLSEKQKEEKEVQTKTAKYSSQFNPDLARQNRI